MIKYLLLFIFLVLLLTKCNHPSGNIKKNYVESKPSFFELHNSNWLTNKWIRKPKNLLMIHETFKKFGYLNLISTNLLIDNPLIIQDIYLNKQVYQLLDSLALTYNQKNIKEKYYKEFWHRRKAEKNDSIVYQIIKDIKYAFKSKIGSGILSIDADDSIVNDTLLHLLEIEFSRDTLTKQQALKNFQTLRDLRFHQSAYNLLYETSKYQEIEWNRDSLENTLIQTDKYTNSWFPDDNK